VYRLTIASRGSVRVAVASLFDAVVSIRRTCGELASELACNDDDPATDHAFGDRRAALTLDLQPGTYFVVVDGFNPDQQGDFEVSAELVRP
jgi:hypothetical protein